MNRWCSCLLTLIVFTSLQAKNLQPSPTCRIESEAPILRVTSLLQGVRPVDSASDVRLVVENAGPSTGEVRVDVTTFSAVGVETIQRVVAGPMGPHGRTLLDVPVGALRLPAAELDFSGRIALVVSAEWAGGGLDTVERPLSLFFHPHGDGWLLYDAEARDEQFDGGLLTSKARRRADVAQERDARAGASFIRLLSEDPDFKPGGKSVTNDAGTARTARAAGDPLFLDVDVVPIVPGVKFCLKQVSTFVDGGVGEDFWQNSWATARWSRGSEATVERGGSVIWSGFLGDGPGADDPGKGCTPNLGFSWYGSREYTITITSNGEAQGNSVTVVDDAIGTAPSFSTTVEAVYGTYEITVDPAATDEEFNVYMAGAYAIARHSGGMSGKSYDFRMNYSASQYDPYGNTIYISDRHTFKKFIIGHEQGHAMGFFGIGHYYNKLVNLDCSYSSSLCPESGGSHSMTSMEYSGCALGEGWAHMFSASVYNDQDETDCRFEYWSDETGSDSTPMIDCEGTAGGFSEAFMEATCETPWDGYGTELDWFRALWDVYTDSDSPNLAEVLAWMKDANAWADDEAFDELDTEADTVGGNLDTNWDAAKTANGIDH